MTIPPWLPAFVRSRIEADLVRNPQQEAWLAEQNGMVLYGTIGHHAVLREDGSVWFYQATDWVNSDDFEWELALGKDRIGALMLGTKRYPELLELLPVRPSLKPDCERCTGAGEIHGGLQCPNCAGLGWVPDGAT